MHFLVTGGAGFIGCHLCKSLLNRGHTVTILDSLEEPIEYRLENITWLGKNAGVDFIDGSILDTELCKAAVTDAVGVFHLAGLAGVRRSLDEPEKYYENNVRGTASLLSALALANPIPVVFASSSSVYGNCENREDVFPKPLTPYGRTKFACEQLLSMYCSSHETGGASMRLFSVYGPKMRYDLALRKFAAAICSGETISLFGNCKRDYTHVSDIVTGLISAMTHVHTTNTYDLFNLGRGESVETLALIRLLEKYTGRTAKIEDIGRQEGDADATCADIKKAQRALNYSPRVDIDRGVYDFVRWLCP